MTSAPVELIKVPRSTDIAWPELWPEDIGVVMIGRATKIAYYDPREEDLAIEARVNAKFGVLGALTELDSEAEDFIEKSCALEDKLRSDADLLEGAEDFELEIDFVLSEGLPQNPVLKSVDHQFAAEEDSRQVETGAQTYESDSEVIQNTIADVKNHKSEPEALKAQTHDRSSTQKAQTSDLFTEQWLPLGHDSERIFMSWGKVTAHDDMVIFNSDLVNTKTSIKDAAMIAAEDISVQRSGLVLRAPATAAKPTIAFPAQAFIVQVPEDGHLDAHLTMDMDYFYLTIFSAPKIQVVKQEPIVKKKDADRRVLLYMMVSLLTFLGVAALSASGLSGREASGGHNAETAVGSIRDGLFGG